MKGKRHGIRDARQYRSPGFETLLRNHDIRGRQGALQGLGAVGQAGADELVKTSIDGGINFLPPVADRLPPRVRATEGDRTGRQNPKQ